MKRLTKGKAEAVLNLITEMADDGCKDKDIAEQLDYRLDEVKLIIKKLYKDKFIFRNLSQNKWKLVKYRRDTDSQANSTMEWN